MSDLLLVETKEPVGVSVSQTDLHLSVDDVAQSVILEGDVVKTYLSVVGREDHVVVSDVPIYNSLDDIPDGTIYERVVASALQDGQVLLTQAIGNLDDVQDGVAFAKVLGSYINADGSIDWTQVNFDTIPDGVLYGKLLSSALTSGLVYMDNIVNGTYGKIKLAGLSADGFVLLDSVVDGTYGKVLSTSITAGKILLTEAVGTLDSIADGVTYGKVLNASISAGKISLDAGIVDGGTYSRVLTTSISAGKILLAEAVGTVDNIADGTTYGKVKITNITAGMIVLAECTGTLDDIENGTYGKVLATTITAGKIVLSASNYSDFTSDMVTEASGKWFMPISKTPSGSGLFISTSYMGYYTEGAWKTYIASDGKFYFRGDANNYIYWNGVSLVIRGVLTVGDMSGLGALATLSVVDWSTLVTGAGKPADSATVGAIWGTNLVGIPTRLADSVTVTGVYVTPTYIGFYDAGAANWPIRILNDGGTGKFFVGSVTNYISWDGATLIVVGGGTFSGALSAATGTFSGALSAATGTFAGALSAATGSFSGTITTSNITATGGTIAGFGIGSHILWDTTVGWANFGTDGGLALTGTSAVTINTNSTITMNGVVYIAAGKSISFIGPLHTIYTDATNLIFKLIGGNAFYFYSDASLIASMHNSDGLYVRSHNLCVDTGSYIKFDGTTGNSYAALLSGWLIVGSTGGVRISSTSAVEINSSSTITLNGITYISAGKTICFVGPLHYIHTDGNDLIFHLTGNAAKFEVGASTIMTLHNTDGVFIRNHNLMLDAGKKVYLAGYSGGSPVNTYILGAADKITMTATYFTVTSQNLSTDNGAFAINGAYLYWRHGGTSYKVLGTAV